MYKYDQWDNKHGWWWPTDEGFYIYKDIWLKASDLDLRLITFLKTVFTEIYTSWCEGKCVYTQIQWSKVVYAF